MFVGKIKGSNGGRIRFRRYPSGETAIEVMATDGSGETEFIPTAALVDYGAPDPGERGVYLKNYSGNEGAVQALVDSGIVELTGLKVNNGYVDFFHANLTDMAWEELQRQLGSEGGETNASQGGL